MGRPKVAKMGPMSDAPEPMASQAIRAPLVGMAVNASLAVIKILAGTFGNSYALIADGIESTSDIVTSLVVWGGLQVATRPADRRHPYGYGKAESLAGIVGALALLAAAGTIAVQSLYEINLPHHLPHWSTLAVLASVIVIKLALGRWVGSIGDEYDSTALASDAWHHRSDALTSLAAFVGISIGLVGGPGYEPADDYAALVACLVIAASGLRLLWIATRDVLDVAPSREFEDQVRAVAASIPGVMGIEKCRIRKSGLTYFAEIHVQVDGNATVGEGHAIGGRVRAALRSSPYRIADAFVHIEPHSVT
jgi:cation diffusion facilitator family transporter